METTATMTTKEQAAKTKPKTYIMDGESLAFLDELTFRLKRKDIRGVSASKIVRVAVTNFARLDESAQIDLLTD